ncbi:hypothetical protein GOBAR_AA23817 [Gossypium barbadense]|uniref:Uncharacterized protein n=1 Tax=Gossypium barbadense TaxID=3634 RepID=A0A2P5X0G8_GOSBA|nr:hypothetical protein GOBAR_AA23817 [Gossypium barbadense]
MGNALRFLYGKCCKPSTSGDSDSVGPPYTTTAPGVSALAYDHFNFETTSQEMIIFVPEDLSEHVVSSRKAQVKWYGKLLQAWKEVKPPPKTPKEVARLIVETLSRHQKADVEPLQLRVNISRENITREENQVPNREQNRNEESSELEGIGSLNEESRELEVIWSLKEECRK